MFSIRLRNLRIEKGLTQKELADILNMQNIAISKYELGERNPDNETLINLANYFSVSTDYLLGKSDVKNSYKDSGDKTHHEITDIEEAMKVLLDQPGLMLKGEILDDNDKIILANAIQMGLKLAEDIKNKKHN